MAQKKKINTVVNNDPRVQAQASFTPPAIKPQGINILLNVVLLLVSLFFVMILVKKVEGYKWVRETLFKENLEFIKKYPSLTNDQKLESKLGFDYSYIRMLKDTPENAIIIMPRRSLIDSVRKQNQAFALNSGGIFNGTWSEYFVYPRQLVYEEQKDTDPLYKKATHVAILNYSGYEKLNYQVADSSKVAYGVAAISK